MYLRVRRRLLSMAIAISLLPLPVAAVRLHRLLLLPVEILHYEEETTGSVVRTGGARCVARFIYRILKNLAL